MVSINDISKEVLLMDCRSGNGSKNDAILGVHEAASKLWADVKHDKGQADVEKRVANIIIGVLVAARRMGMSDIEAVLQERVWELKKELN